MGGLNAGDASAVSSRLVAKVVLVACAVLAGLYLAYLIRSVLFLLLIGLFFALALAPAVNWLDQRRVPRWIAILMVYLAIAAGIVGVGLLLVTPIVKGVDKLSHDLPGYIDDLNNNPTFRKYNEKYHIVPKLKKQAEQLPTKLGDAVGTLRDVTVGVFNRVVELFSILVITFLLLLDGPKLLAFFYKQMSEEREARVRAVSRDISEAISGYVFGNFVISVIAASVTWITLTILNVPFAVPLAVLFGFFDLIPLVGATLGAILVGIVVAFVNFPTGVIVWVAVQIVYQQIENNLLQPVVYGKSVQIHPLVVIVAVLIGAALLGILGVLLAIPAAAAMQAVVRDWWRFRQAAVAPANPLPEAAES